LHTNTAVGAVTRLLDMGMESFLIASSIVGVLSQRLVRKLCPSCAESYAPSEQERELLGESANADTRLKRAVGCAVCENTGFRGRTGIYELITIDDHLRAMIHEHAGEEEMVGYARRTVKSITQSGFDRVRAGVTSIDEVLRVSIDN
ncbi:GspE/PulE family protein, partial [Pseudomonadota bacterium]